MELFVSYILPIIYMIILFLLLIKINKTINSFGFLVGKFAQINQNIYEQQNHLIKKGSENLEKQNKIIQNLSGLRKDFSNTESHLKDIIKKSES